jgi:cell division protein FtsI (penicillin-binding protein 3)
VEATYDAVLRGKSYEVPGLRDAFGKPVYSEGFVPQAVLEGDDVVLTLDRHIQHAAEVALEHAVTENEGVAGVALVMRPRTGDVLALASYPAFNPNNLTGAAPNEQLDRAVSAVYEPGSTMKMITIAAALEEGLLTPDDTIDCEGGKWRVGGRTIGDAHHKYGVLTISDVLKFSSNICAAKIGLQLGRDRLNQWLNRFEFGRLTGIDLPGELKGFIRPVDQWREIGLANIAFGQGILVTPLQVIQAAAAIANGGELVHPRLLLSTVDRSGRATPAPRDASVRILSAETAAKMNRMMIEVTHKGGTAERAAVPGFAVAGKTGTAQKVDPVTGAYSHSLFVASFVGYLPAERPEVVVLVAVDEPKKSTYGGTVAAPAFREIAMAALSALEIYPEDEQARRAFMGAYRDSRPTGPQTPAPASVPAPQVASVGAADNDEADEMALSSQARSVLGAGVAAKPTANASPPPAGAGRMPNFAGLQLREVLNRSAEVHCDLMLKGAGRVVKQKPEPGAVLVRGGRCEIELAPSG